MKSEDVFWLDDGLLERIELSASIRTFRALGIPELLQKADEYQAKLSRMRRQQREHRKSNTRVLRCLRAQVKLRERNQSDNKVRI